MNICALMGGPHKKGNTATLLEAVLEGARAAARCCLRHFCKETPRFLTGALRTWRARPGRGVQQNAGCLPWLP